MSEWGWSPERNLGIWRHGAAWLKPLMAAVPYLTVLLLLVLLWFVGGTMSAARGVLFDLPAGDFSDTARADLVALVMPVRHECVVFFDDARYLLDDEGSMRGFSESVSERLRASEGKTLLILADRRVPSGRLMEAVAAARRCGVGRVLVAGRRNGGGEQ